MHRRRGGALDELDMKILSLLCEDARMSAREIAEKLGVASGTVYSRIRRMTEDGVIKGYIPLLDSGRLGYLLTALIFLQVEGPYIVDVENEVAEISDVAAVYDITGEFDVAILARFRSQVSMNSFIKNTLKIPHIRRSVTSVVLNIVKEEPRTGIIGIATIGE